MSESAGEFAHRHTGSSFSTDASGTVIATSNWEGEATGFGAVFGSLHVPLGDSNATSGSCSWVGQAFLEDGTWATGVGEGTWEQVGGGHQWKLHFPALTVSSGEVLRCEGVIDLESRTFTGQMYEA